MEDITKTQKDTMEAQLETINCMEKEIAILEDRLERYKLYARIRSDKGKSKKGRSKHFTQLLIGPSRKLVRQQRLSNKAYALIFCLLPFLKYEENYIVDEEGQKLNISDLSKIIGWHRISVTKALKELHEADLLALIKERRNTYVYLNPIYFVRGNTSSEDNVA